MGKPSDELTDQEHAIRERIEAKLGPRPERAKSLEDMTPADHEARRRGELVESDAYREYQAKVRRAAGLDSGGHDDSEDPAAQARRKYGGNR